MKIIEGSQSLTKSQPRFVEVGDKILMNGAVYNFDDFAPVPYNWCEVDCHAFNGDRIAFNKDYIVSYDTRSENTTYQIYSDPHYFNTGVYDVNDETVYYKATEGATSDTNKNNNNFSKLKIYDGRVKLLKTIAIGLNNVQIIGQNDEYLFVTGYKPEHSTVNYHQVNMATTYGVVKKDTLTYSELLSSANAHTQCTGLGPVKLIKETSDYIILVQSTNAYTNNTNAARNNGDIQIIRVDKVARTVQRLKKTHFLVEADSHSSYCVVNEYENFLMRDANRYLLYQAMYHKTENVVKLYSNIVNVHAGFIGTDLLHESKSEVEIDWDNASDDIIEKFTSPRRCYDQAYAHSIRYKFIYNKCANKSYLTLVHYRTVEGNNASATDKYTGACAFTFSMNAYDNLKFESYTELPRIINAFMSLDDEGKRMYGIDNNNLYYIEFNEMLKKLEVVNTNNLIPTSVGIDSAGRTWVISSNKDVHMFNENVSAKVSLGFKDAAYDYTGVEIDTGLLLSCTNVFGTKINAELELEIRGNAYFKLTGSKKVRVTTLPLTDTEVSVVINGPGQLSVIPKVIL